MRIAVFTDGACSGNPGPGGWGAILVKDGAGVLEIGGGERATTNNRMELQAAIEALKRMEPGPRARFYCDSSYVVYGMRSWIASWKRLGWKNSRGSAVLNRDLWEELDSWAARFGKANIEWTLVPAHSGIPANERCDRIAVAFSKGKTPELYQGALSGYPVSLGEVVEGFRG